MKIFFARKPETSSSATGFVPGTARGSATGVGDHTGPMSTTRSAEETEKEGGVTVEGGRHEIPGEPTVIVRVNFVFLATSNYRHQWTCAFGAHDLF